MTRHHLFAALVIAAYITGMIYLCVALDSHNEPPACDHYADWAIRDVPARCMSYFQGDPR